MADVTADYLALRRSVAAVRLPRQVIRVFGADAVKFLDGQLSQDVAALHPGEHAWSLLLEPQGKVIAWLRLWGRHGGDEVLMDVAAGAGQAVLDRLNRFRLRVDAELELLDWECVALRGPGSSAVEVRAELRAEVDWAGLSGVDLLGPELHLPEGLHLAGADAYEAVRIEAGWPETGSEITWEPEPSVIAAEIGSWFVDASASFTKGCYTGQELVARIDSRGNNTPRRLRGLVLGENVLPPVGATVVAEERDRGTLTSVGESLDLRAPIALGFVHRSVEPGAEVILRWEGLDGEPVEAAAHVRELPLVSTTVE